ncbi:MAG: Rpn family recombination-promoting nuclease/putative transposase [Acidobacteriota bacterium]
MSTRNLSSPHDRSRRRLFSHPEVIEDLLRGALSDSWIEDLDFSTLSRESEITASDDLDERITDIVWSVRWRQRRLFLLILVEFQSRPDHFMALRKLVYVGRFYQELVRRRDWLPGRHLPPVLPIVVYNGERTWRAPRRLRELIARVPPELSDYQPDLSYLLVEELTVQPRLDGSRDLFSAIAALEQSTNPEDLLQVVERLIEWLQDEDTSDLRRAFAAWLRLVLMPVKLGPDEDLYEIDDLLEMRNMLEQRMQRWFDDQKRRMETEILTRVRGEVRGEVREELRGEIRNELRIELLVKLLERKFGPLSEAHRQRVDQASGTTLERWVLEMVDAATIDEVFTDHA